MTEGNVTLRHLAAVVVIPFREPVNHGQREACLVELNLDTARMIPGTRVVLAAVRDTGSVWR